MGDERSVTRRPAWREPGRIDGVNDARRVLEGINAAGLDRDNTALARQLLQTAGDAAFSDADAARVLPAAEELSPLLPWPSGIRQGATVGAVGSTSLLMTLLAGAMVQGSWAAVVGLPNFGALAAGQDFRIPLSRLALVPEPGPDWPTVVSALIDGFDMVAVANAPGTSENVTRALMGRARQRGCVLIPTTAWAGCDLTIELVERRWSGLGQGHGRLRRQEVTLQSRGRGRAAQARTISTMLPPPSIMPPYQVASIAPPPYDPTHTVTAAEPQPRAKPRNVALGFIESGPAPTDVWKDLISQMPPSPPRRQSRRTPPR